jgi:hypothetical protein
MPSQSLTALKVNSSKSQLLPIRARDFDFTQPPRAPQLLPGRFTYKPPPTERLRRRDGRRRVLSWGC